MNNLRIRSREFQLDGGSWAVTLQNSKTFVPYIKGILRDLQREEPGVGWHLETRGTGTPWHHCEPEAIQCYIK